MSCLPANKHQYIEPEIVIRTFPCSGDEFYEIKSEIENLPSDHAIKIFVTWGLGGFPYAFIICRKHTSYYSIKICLHPPACCNVYYALILHISNLSYRETIHELNNCLIRYQKYRFKKWIHKPQGKVPKELLFSTRNKIWPRLDR